MRIPKWMTLRRRIVWTDLDRPKMSLKCAKLWAASESKRRKLSRKQRLKHAKLLQPSNPRLKSPKLRPRRQLFPKRKRTLFLKPKLIFQDWKKGLKRERECQRWNQARLIWQTRKRLAKSTTWTSISTLSAPHSVQWPYTLRLRSSLSLKSGVRKKDPNQSQTHF